MDIIILGILGFIGFFIILPIVLFVQLFNRTEDLSEQVSVLQKKIRELDGTHKNDQTITHPASVSTAAPTTTVSIKPLPIIPKIPTATAPSFFEKHLATYFTGGKALVSTGIIILFFGIAFLLKYVSSQIEVPLLFRFIGVAIAATAMTFTGWWFVGKRRIFGLALQGGGIGILFLTTFSAFHMYHLIDATPAFGLLIVFGALSALLALKNDAKELAVLAAIGGFLAPVLVSTGTGSHIILFSYYLILNLAILAIAWFKTWRLLNLVGFGFTFVISTVWGMNFYHPSDFATTEPFLILFFLLYVLVAILFSTRQTPYLKGYMDGTIVFGVPLVGAGLQIAMTRTIEHGATISAVATGVFYLLLWYTLHPQQNKGLHALSKAFLALGLIFLTLAIPLIFDTTQTASLWALEGAAIIWVNMRQKNIFCRSFGVVLQFGAGLWLYLSGPIYPQGIAVFNSYYISSAIVSIAALFSAYLYNRYKETLSPIEKKLAPSTALGIWGMMWWFGSGINEIRQFVPHPLGDMSLLGFIAASTLLMEVIGHRYQTGFLRKPIFFLLPFMTFIATMRYPTGLDGVHPFMNGGIVAWPAAFIAQYTMLRLRDKEALPWYHAGSLWLLMFLIAKEASYFIQLHIGQSETLLSLPWFIIPALIIGFISRKPEVLPWPFNRHHATYISLWMISTLCFLAIVFVYSAWNLDGSMSPLPIPYIPLVNALDIAHLAVIISVGTYVLHVKKYTPTWLTGQHLTKLIAYPALFLFLWANAAVLRAVHHLTGIAYSYTPLFQSPQAQTSLTLLWTLTATSLMVYASRRYMRAIWFIGASMLGITILKLFMIDLADTGTLARIISFIGVGGLTLALGYFSPVPPEGRNMRNRTSNISPPN
jgi:uncharacterized membrane protein